MLVEFKDYVDSCTSSISGLGNDHIAICKQLGIEISNSYSESMVIDRMHQIIKEQLSPGESEPFISHAKFRELEDALVYDSILNERDNSEYLLVFKEMTSTGNRYRTFDCKSSWVKAIVQAKNYIVFKNKTFLPYGTFRDEYAKAYDVGQAARKLRELGCRVKINDTVLDCSDGLTNIIKGVEEKIVEIGGITLMNTIFHFLLTNGFFIKDFNRYVIAPVLKFSSNTSMPMCPYGYLLNLAVKYPHNGKLRFDQKIFDQKLHCILETSILVSTVLGVQPYSSWEVHFRQKLPFSEYVRSMALFDSIFTVPSGDISTVIDFIEAAFSWADDEKFQAVFDFSIQQFIRVCKAISSLVNGRNGCGVIYLSKVKKICSDIDEPKIKLILSCMAHRPNEVNKEFIQITDYDKRSFGFKPLIEITPTKFLLCDIFWCSISFFEVIASCARSVDDIKRPMTDINIGIALEGFVKNKLSNRKVEFVSGHYQDGQRTKGECDVLIETNKAIILIEVKKKALSRNASAGHDVYLILDLAASLLDAQIQTGRTEILLREKGYVDIIGDDGAVKKVELKGRLIERIALTHLDYGSFQDRTFLTGILEMLIDSRFSLISKDDSRLVERFNTINKKCELWAQQAVELQKLQPDFDHYPFFDCWFLSLPQLLVLLEQASDAETFYAEMESIKYTTMASSNFYFEYHNVKRTDSLHANTSQLGAEYRVKLILG